MDKFHYIPHPVSANMFRYFLANIPLMLGCRTSTPTRIATRKRMFPIFSSNHWTTYDLQSSPPVQKRSTFENWAYGAPPPQAWSFDVDDTMARYENMWQTKLNYFLQCFPEDTLGSVQSAADIKARGVELVSNECILPGLGVWLIAGFRRTNWGGLKLR